MFLKPRKLVISFVLVIFGFTIGISAAYAYNVDRLGGFSPKPGIVKPGSSFASESITDFGNAAAAWDAEAGNAIDIGSTTSNTVYPKNNDLNEVTKGNRGTNEYLMQATYVDTSFVWNGLFWEETAFEVDIDVNTSYPWHNSGAAGYYDVQSVFTHELGHMLGLGHSDVNTATMWPTVGKGDTTWSTLDPDDIAGIKAIY